MLSQANNIKKLVKELEAYYRDALQLDCPRASAVEPAAVASGDGAAIARLLELVLGCAVQCDGKERYVSAFHGYRKASIVLYFFSQACFDFLLSFVRYIQRIMGLDKDAKADLMILTRRILQVPLSAGAPASRNHEFFGPLITLLLVSVPGSPHPSGQNPFSLVSHLSLAPRPRCLLCSRPRQSPAPLLRLSGPIKRRGDAGERRGGGGGRRRRRRGGR